MISENLKNRNVETFCNYIAYLDSERVVFGYSGFSRDEFSQEFYGRVDNKSVKWIKEYGVLGHLFKEGGILGYLLWFYGFIILRELRGENIINSGFFAYKGNIVKLNGVQVKRIMENVFEFEITENDRFIDSPCSIPKYNTIEQDVNNDDDISDDEKELLKEI